MNVRFPLSLKVSLWLLLNLALLALLGGAFFVSQSGFGWNALVSGPAGHRLQTMAELIRSELRLEPSRSPDALLARYSEAYGVEFSLFQNDGRQIGGTSLALPEEVKQRLAQGRPLRVAPPPDRVPGPPDDDLDGPPARRAPPGDATRGRFLLRTSHPTGYWIAIPLPPLPDPPPGLELLDGQPRKDRATTDAERNPLTARSAGRHGGLTLLLHTPSLRAAALLLDLTPWLVAGAVAFGISILFWLPLVHSITRALGKLTHATEQIAAGRFETRVDARRRDEIGRLGGAVNRMAGQLDQLVSGQKRFLGDIAHELGSPLGRMQLGVGILEERAAPALQPSVADVREEVQHMAALVHELLAFTRAGLRARDAALTRVELASLAATVLARENADALVTVAVPAGLAAQADAELLGRALGNLVRNALRYAAGAGPITLTAAPSGSEVSLVIEDHGPGVPPDTLARLGEPFYRPEFARTRETGGVGLGLAIVKNAVEACRGEVQFSNRSPHGFRAEIRLPAAGTDHV